MLISAIILIAGIAVDQLVKRWAAASLQNIETIPVIQDIFHLTYAENTGAAFSIFEGGRIIFIIVALVVSIPLVYYIFFNGKVVTKFKICLTLILSGALGNVIDRIAYGYVVDMFDFRAIDFAVFNVADSLVVVGSILLILLSLKYDFFTTGKDV